MAASSIPVELLGSVGKLRDNKFKTPPVVRGPYLTDAAPFNTSIDSMRPIVGK